MVEFTLDRATSITYTDGTTVAAYDGGFAPPGLPSVITRPGGGTQRFVYYANGDIATTTDPAGKVMRYEYDGLGRAVRHIEMVNGVPGATTAFQHDRLDRVVSRTDPAVTDRVTGAVHTAVTTTAYNNDGLPTSETVSDTTGGDSPRVVTFGYDGRGRRTSETDALGKTVRLGYDALGRIVREIYADGSAIRTDFDAVGNELAVVLEGYTGDPNNPTPAADLTPAVDGLRPGRPARLGHRRNGVGDHVYLYGQRTVGDGDPPQPHHRCLVRAGKQHLR